MKKSCISVNTAAMDYLRADLKSLSGKDDWSIQYQNEFIAFD